MHLYLSRIIGLPSVSLKSRINTSKVPLKVSIFSIDTLHSSRELSPSEIVWKRKSFESSILLPEPFISDTIQGVEEYL